MNNNSFYGQPNNDGSAHSRDQQPETGYDRFANVSGYYSSQLPQSSPQPMQDATVQNLQPVHHLGTDYSTGFVSGSNDGQEMTPGSWQAYGFPAGSITPLQASLDPSGYNATPIDNPWLPIPTSPFVPTPTYPHTQLTAYQQPDVGSFQPTSVPHVPFAPPLAGSRTDTRYSILCPVVHPSQSNAKSGAHDTTPPDDLAFARVDVKPSWEPSLISQTGYYDPPMSVSASDVLGRVGPQGLMRLVRNTLAYESGLLQHVPNTPGEPLPWERLTRAHVRDQTVLHRATKRLARILTRLGQTLQHHTLNQSTVRPVFLAANTVDEAQTTSAEAIERKMIPEADEIDMMLLQDSVQNPSPTTDLEDVVGNVYIGADIIHEKVPTSSVAVAPTSTSKVPNYCWAPTNGQQTVLDDDTVPYKAYRNNNLPQNKIPLTIFATLEDGTLEYAIAPVYPVKETSTGFDHGPWKEPGSRSAVVSHINSAMHKLNGSHALGIGISLRQGVDWDGAPGQVAKTINSLLKHEKLKDIQIGDTYYELVAYEGTMHPSERPDQEAFKREGIACAHPGNGQYLDKKFITAIQQRMKDKNYGYVGGLTICKMGEGIIWGNN